MNVRVSKTKWTSIAIKIVTAMMLFCLLMAGVRSAQAAVSITAPTLNISTASFPSGYYALGNIVIDEGNKGDFPIAAASTNYTFTISAPTRFEFQAGTGSVSVAAGGDITSISMTITATTITVTYSSSEGNRTNGEDIITISGLQVRAITGVATQTATKTVSSETISGFGNPTVVANFTSTLATGCTHTLTITDTYSDGWNGGTVEVTVNGVPVLTGITLATGSGPEDYTFTAANGDVIVVARTADGSYPSEMRVAITGGSANTILAAQEPVAAPGTSVLGCCAPTVPGLASYTNPSNGAAAQDVCGVTLTWDAPTSNGCNIATSYDVYFGTSATPPFVGNVTTTSWSAGALSTSTTYYWKIVPRNATGAAAGAVTRSFSTSATVCSACTHTIRLTDTYGDGWNGNKISVTVNGVLVLANITMASGFGPEDHTFQAADGDVINVTLTTTGSYSYETRVELLGAAGTQILPAQEPVTAPGTDITGCCPSVLPGCASVPLPVNGESLVNPCSVDLAWTAPAASGCEGASSYDIYFGTTASPAFLINISGTSFVFPYALSDNTTYYWKIVPKNSVGGATGCSVWSFTTGTSPNPNYCLYGNAINYPSAGSNCAQLTSAAATQNGCAWNRGTISFASSFDYSVQMYFGAAAGGADGCAFVFQNSPLGISQCGNNGGQLGAGGISNAVVVEFDTYDNDNPAHVYDMAVDHTAIEVDGDMQGPGAPLCGPVQADPLDGLLADGLMHTLRVTWDPVTTTLQVYVDGSQRLSCVYDYVANVFGGNPNVWWGFTGSTGLLANQQYFCPLTLPVPVELMQFNASCNDGTPLLTWYTASETNNNYFVIERSEDGSAFDSIARVNGSGNTNEIIMYQFLDYTSNGSEIYYRLRQIDFDGNNTELGIVSTKCDQKNILEITAVKDQTESSVTLDFVTSYAGRHIVSLHDVNGKLIEQKAMMCEPGFNQADFCNRPEPGIYFFRISNPMETISYKCKL